MVTRRRLLVVPALAALAPRLSLGAAASKPASLVFYVNDGGSAKSVPEQLAAYKPLSDILASASGQAVTLQIALRGESFEQVVKKSRPSLLFTKTIDYAGRTIRDDGYSVIAKIDAPYIASFIAARSAAAQRLEDLVGTDILLPDPATFTAKLAVATLRSRKIRTRLGYDETGHALPNWPDAVTLRHTRTQDAVATIVGGGVFPDWGVDGGSFQKVGALNPTMAKQWKAKGGRILQDMAPMPNWCVLAATSVPEGTRQALKAALTALSDPQRQALQASIGVKNFVAGTNQEYLDALTFVGEPSTAVL